MQRHTDWTRHIPIEDLPTSQQPRERLRDYGPKALTDAELLAILLRVGLPGLNVIGLAEQLLAKYGGWSGLDTLSFPELCRITGMGEAKAAQVKAALELARRLQIATLRESQGPDHAIRVPAHPVAQIPSATLIEPLRTRQVQRPEFSQKFPATTAMRPVVGSQVRHPRFGLGKIIFAEGTGSHEMVAVDFATVGVKKLLVSMAGLEPL